MGDDFSGLLGHNYGFKPQGKYAPMAPSGNNTSFSLGSNKSAPIFDDHAGNQNNGGDNFLYSDVFGGPPKRSSGYDSVFKEQDNVNHKMSSFSSSLPVFDKPVYDDDTDIFDGLPGLKSTSVGPQSRDFDDVFSGAASSAPKHRSLDNNRSTTALDDFLGSFGELKTESKREASFKVNEESDSSVFDDLLPGFGRSSSPNISRSTSESSRTQKPSTNSTKTASNVMEDPFVGIESASAPTASSSGWNVDSLEDISKFSASGSTKVDDKGILDDMSSLDNLGKFMPPISSGLDDKRGKDRSPLRTEASMGSTSAASSKEHTDKYPVDEAEGLPQNKKSNADFPRSHGTLFDIPSAATDFHGSVGQNVSSPYVISSPNGSNSPPSFEDVSESSEDTWLTISEVPLFTQPTSAPPPSRPPPRVPKSETSSFSSINSRKKVNQYSFSNSNSYSQSPGSAHARRSLVPSQIDEFEDFAMGRTPSSSREHADVLYGDNMDLNASSAAAMKEAMDKAEAKFRQMREREYAKAARNREAGPLDKDLQEAQQREYRERQERLEHERLQREREEEEREQRRLEKERERAREIEREREEKEREQRRLEREKERAREIEREREKGRQAVERATREARERAASEARLRAERAAVEKAAAEARERAERAAVQRAQSEARERAAAEARERAERAAAEARERANAESREREAKERAAVGRAEADARQRAERAAVERAAAEARERAAAAARASHQRNDSQQRNENDFESFFTSRANSAPRPTNSSDPFSDTLSKGGFEAAKKTSVGATSYMKKASSTANIVDDLSSIFGGTGASGEFQEVEGETEERRRARLERHHRTQERAAKALAEKNQRDLQAQREQAERHRIAETLDVEIKRWAAGKEGNLRALLSTLQYVLWPECGWQPVSLTDLITGAAVKKVYRKATLCIHPDKVQQKGASLQQKYIAEKVFDLLKEAWNKFNSEELF